MQPKPYGGNDVSATTYVIKLSTDCVTVKEDMTLAELVKRCDFGTTPAAGGDVITITRDEE